MSKKYLVGFTYTSFKSGDKLNAMSKARMDVEHTCKDLGFEVSNVCIKKRKVRLFSHFSMLIELIIKAITIDSKSDVYVQYPIANPQLSYVFYFLLRLSKCKLIYIVHDIEMLRYHRGWVKHEVRVLNQADRLLVHTLAMQDKLKELGVIVPMTIINLFDYYTESTKPSSTELLDKKEVVAFAGNLMKSGFLKELQKMVDLHDVVYRLYGLKGSLDLSECSKMEYCQAFVPEDVYVIKSGWGLVWDGNKSDTCSGLEGEYLKYNASHKASLYIVAGIPLIVWKESALAKFVENNHLGISVSSLNQIPELLRNITDEDYMIFVENVSKLSDRLKNGELLKSALKGIE